MTPTPQNSGSEETVAGSLKRPLAGDEVVISGMSGIFPSSDSVQEFSENLYNKVDMVTTENPRWVFNHPEVPKHLGKVNGMGKFDAQFFRVHYKQAFTMEPMSRKLLEHAYSAIYDSGINPLQLRGKKVGVFIGSTFSESEKIVIYENVQRNGFGITGCNKAMYANRISYWIDGKGPSYALDLACASSMACLEHAYRSISSGQCDAAIVGGCNLCMHPNVSLNCRRAGFLCLDGKTKCFDKNGDGYVRSDAIGVMFLQKAKDAKRIYSEVYHAKASYSPASEQLLPVREPKELQEFLEAFYSEIDISPEDVEYVEANGAAFPEADYNELKAISKVFGKEKSIKIGCVKSNMGSSEPASGICGLTKVCLAYHSGKISANLHYNNPLDLPELQDNKVQVLTDNAEFGRGFAALNSFSYSGANVHVLLKGHYKPKDTERYQTSIPHLVLVSGRQDNCVRRILDNLKKFPIDSEQIGLLHNIHQFDIPGHMSRGYSLLGTNENQETTCFAQSAEYYPGKPRPVWFVYSGMGSQWATMGDQLMRIPIFAAAIQKCHKVLEPKGIDIIKILCDPDKTIYDNILNSFVGIAAVQIGLTDILKEMGIVPDNIIGHSVGELGCAYADGCFTAEEMILSAYSRGLVSVQTPFIRGSMAAIGLGYKDILPLCPPEIEVACHNSSESATISGPADIMKQFVSELTSQGIFAKEVPCSNIAFHSRYISKAGPGLLNYLSEVIKNPRPRSEKWVSTSVPQEKWDDPVAKYSSAEYHTNNLLNSVLFEETSKLIPSDALVIEVAPHGLLQAILKRSLNECIHVPLTKRGSSDTVKFFLEAVGKLYQAGLNPKVHVIYPEIEYPVSTGTPFLSQFVEWEHSEEWSQAKYNTKDRVVSTVRDFVMSIHDEDYKYFIGHVRDGNYVFPEAAYLVIVWETLAMFKGVNYKNMSVVFQNVQFHGEAIVRPELPVRLQVMILKGNNKFEITYEDYTIVSGFISDFKTSDRVRRDFPQNDSDRDNVFLSSKDIYAIMRMRGYGYKNEFQSIRSSTSNRNKASIQWNDNWITHLDSLFQFNAFARTFDGVSAPSLINKLRIDVDMHKNAEQTCVDTVTCLNAELFNAFEHTRCGGVEVDGLIFNDRPIIEQHSDILQTRTFVPNIFTGTVPLKIALQVNLQIVSENVIKDDEQVMNLIIGEIPELSKTLAEVVTELHGHKSCIQYYSDETIQSLKYADLVIMDNLLGNQKKMDEMQKILPNNKFILSLEHQNINIHPQYKSFRMITALSAQNRILILLKKVDTNASDNITFMPIVHDQKFSWISQLQTELTKSKRVILISERQPYCGLLGIVNKLRSNYGDKIGLIVVDDYQVPSFDPTKDIFKNQLEKNLVINVLKKGKWGGYYNVSSNEKNQLENIYLTSNVAGDIDALLWTEGLSKPTNDNVVKISYAGASIVDAETASGKINPDKQVFGLDFSGMTTSGERVMGLVSGGALASTVVADPDLLWPVPEYWTLEDAATVPLAYVHAYYCLVTRYNLCRRDKVVITNGSEALGQALIAICLSMECELFITVSNTMQKDFLLRIFPDLKENHIGLPEMILNEVATAKNRSETGVIAPYNLHGCDLIINCLSGEKRKAVKKCTGFRGTFIDTCAYDMTKNEDFGMQFLINASTYIAANLNTIFKPDYANTKKQIQMQIMDGIAKGVVRPISRVVYPPANVSKAFRLIASNKNCGRVLIKMNNSKTTNAPNATAKISYSSKGSYIVICDGTELSIQFADRLIKRGAQNLVIHLKPVSIAGYCYTMFSSWNKLNVSMKISSENLQTEKGCVNLLKEAAKLGPIQGIFIVHNFNSTAETWTSRDVSAKFNNTAIVVANLDLISRNICNKLDHFVILNYASQNMSDEYVYSVTDKICSARNEIGLPALVFRAGPVIELDDVEFVHSKIRPQPLSAMFNALETSMKLKQNNVIAYNLKKNDAAEFIQKVSRIIGVKNILELDDNLTLKDLLLNEVNIEEINTALRNTYQINYPLKKLETISVGEIKNLGRDLSQTINTKVNGLGAFFTYIDRDECTAAEPIVTMATSFSCVKEEEELDPKATYVMLVPGFEGHHQIFTTVSERLKVQAMTLQLVPDMANDSIPQIAAHIAKYMRNRLELRSKFYLLGYSFGVNVALELARIFESEGHVGVVYCLDSSPDALRAQLDAYVGKLSDSQLQNAIIEHMYKLMAEKHSDELNKALKTIDNWNEKVELCVNKLRGLVKYSHQYKRCLLHSAYRRIILAREYEPDFILESELVLIKGIPHPNIKELPEEFNLSKYTSKPVKVFDIQSDHVSAHQDCRVSNIINTLLEPTLLEEYKNKNLLWTYLANPVKAW